MNMIMLYTRYHTWRPHFSWISWQPEPQLASLPFRTPVSWGQRRHSGWEQTEARRSTALQLVQLVQIPEDQGPLNLNISPGTCMDTITLLIQYSAIKMSGFRFALVFPEVNVETGAFKLQPRLSTNRTAHWHLVRRGWKKKSNQTRHLCISVQRKAAGTGRALRQQSEATVEGLAFVIGARSVFGRRRHSGDTRMQQMQTNVHSEVWDLRCFALWVHADFSGPSQTTEKTKPTSTKTRRAVCGEHAHALSLIS